MPFTSASATLARAAAMMRPNVWRETPIRSCKVALYCDKCGKGVRVGFKVEDGKKTRICRKCGAEI